MKKINGHIVYFGKWGRVVKGVLTRIQDDGAWADALKLYQSQAEALHAGRRPRGKRASNGTDDAGDVLTVADLCNRFLTAKLRKRTAGELGGRMFVEYRATTDLIVAAFGKDRPVDDLAADDFEELRAKLAERVGPVRLGNEITRVKSVFKYGMDNDLIERAVRFGGEFKKPDKAVLRRHRAKAGEKMFDAAELRRIIDAAGVPMRAMVLLGINAGFGNTDVASLPFAAVDLAAGLIDFPRPKTGVARRCPLWPETVTAIREAVAIRPTPKSGADADIVFLVATGRRWVRPAGDSVTNNLSIRFAELLKSLALHRDGLNFYALRHTFRTVADAARDPVAIDLIMGHSDPSMGAHYRERIDDDRLRAVADHVRRWLFGAGTCAPATPTGADAGAGTSRPKAGPSLTSGLHTNM